jgi:choice-of-anchor C domain-containing protein
LFTGKVDHFMSTFQNWGRRLLAGILAVGTMTGLGVVTAAPAHALTGFGNGSFENPVLAPNTFDTVFLGEPIGEWTVSQGNVDHIGAGFWQAADGVQSLDLDGGAVRGGVAQEFTTVPLLKYKVRFKLAGNVDQGPAVKTGEVLANGNVLRSFSFDITGKSRANMGYVSKETHFIATGLSTTLTFRSTTGSGYGPVIDKVTVESCLLVICLG